MNFLDLIKKKAVREPTGIEYERIFEEKARLVTFINPYAYLIARNHLDIFSKIDYYFFDGISLVILLRRLLGLPLRRRSFDMTSLASTLFFYCENNEKTIFIVGTEQALLEQAIRNILLQFPRLKIVGSRNGFFKNDIEMSNTLKEIVAVNPDYLIVGMGTPIQESFLVQAKETGWTGVGFTCGGFIHQTSTDVKYYPDFFDKYNLRWIYRIVKEKHLRNRFIKHYPKFPFLFLKDLLKKCGSTN